MAEQQVFSEHEQEFGGYSNLFWNWSAPNNSVVPPKKILKITTLTLNCFAKGGTVGRADISGRDSNGSAVWRLQIVYVEPLKTVHLPFPNALRLDEGGRVELGFVNDGPGTIFISANGRLVDTTRPTSPKLATSTTGAAPSHGFVAERRSRQSATNVRVASSSKPAAETLMSSM